MKRKLIVFLMSIATCAALLFAAVACSVTSDYRAVQSAYGRIDEAQKIVKTVQVMQGETLLNSREETYERAEEGYRYTQKERHLNSIGEGDGINAYTETVSESVILSEEEVSFGAFPSESALSEATYSEEASGFTLHAALSDLSVLNLSAEQVDGAVSVFAEVGDERLVLLEVTYLTQNGNSIRIAFDYTY